MLNPFKKGTSLLDQAVPIAELLSQVQQLVGSGGLDKLKGANGGGKVIEEEEQ
jgi:hypothetical protein